MNQVRVYDEEAARSVAADWLVRLQSDDVTADEALAFDAWLDESRSHAAAYDRALAVWSEIGGSAEAVETALRTRRPARPAPTRRFYITAGAIAAAAALAVLVLPALTPPPAPAAYQTARGERQSVTLADGSRIDLNAGTRMTVALGRDERRVELTQGQAVFDVAADATRPFVIAAGDRIVRVVGTQFDVRRRDGRLSVTVARGVVEVRPTDGAQGQAFRLRPGQRLDHMEGAAGAKVSAAAPEEVLGWRAGRLVYRDRPLAEVVADLNDQFDTPIRIADPRLADVPVSGVLVLDDEDAVIRRLALVAPLAAERSDSGVVLRYKDARR